jgi:hypothetical protein
MPSAVTSDPTTRKTASESRSMRSRISTVTETTSVISPPQSHSEVAGGAEQASPTRTGHNQGSGARFVRYPPHPTNGPSASRITLLRADGDLMLVEDAACGAVEPREALTQIRFGTCALYANVDEPRLAL